jgi:hypothetical protein
METASHTLARPRMLTLRLQLVAAAIVLPYAARIAGSLLFGSAWLTSFVGVISWQFMIWIPIFNAFWWGPILLGTFLYRNPKSAALAAALGFVVPALFYMFDDLSGDPQTALSVLVIAVLSMPFALLGVLSGWFYDRQVGRKAMRS